MRPLDKDDITGVMFIASVIAVLFFVAFGIATLIHKSEVGYSNSNRVYIERENRMWEMLAGKRPINNSPEGHVARVIKPAFDKEDAAGALLKIYIPPTEFGNDNYIIMTPLVEPADDTSLSGSEGGRLTDEFILKAVRAKTDPKLVQQSVPPLRDDGRMTWTNLAIGTSAPLLLGAIGLLLYALVSWPVRTLQQHRQAKAHRTYLDSLPYDARQIYQIREVLMQMEGTVEVQAARRKANDAFRLATLGWKDAEQRATLNRLLQDLGVISEGVQAGQQKLQELS